MNNENKNTNNIKEETINALNNSGDNMDTINSNSNSDIKPIQNTRYNIQNLRPYNKTDNVLSSEEAKRRGRNGAKKSAEVRKARKTMRETIINMISQEVDPDKLASMGVDIDSLGGDYTYQAAIIAAMLREAVNGDTKAMALLRDTMGEQPALHTVNQTEIVTKDDLKTMDNLKEYLIG